VCSLRMQPSDFTDEGCPALVMALIKSHLMSRTQRKLCPDQGWWFIQNMVVTSPSILFVDFILKWYRHPMYTLGGSL
jgi:hypothetical protein